MDNAGAENFGVHAHVRMVIRGHQHARHCYVVIFGQGLFGGVHWTDNDGGLGNGFAVVPGGGAIFMINDMFGVKG
jgi:hypothetical protein